MLRRTSPPAVVTVCLQTIALRNRHAIAVAQRSCPLAGDHHRRRRCALQSRRAQRLLESGWVVWVAARHADHPSAAGAVRHKVKGDRDGEFAYVRDACVERALTCRSRSVLPRMLTRTCFALPGRLQEHPNDYSDQLLHPIARLGAHGAALKAVFQEIDRWTPPTCGVEINIPYMIHTMSTL